MWGGVGTGGQSEVRLRAFIGFVYPKMRRLSQGIHQQSATSWRTLDKAERLPRDAQWKLWCWWWSPSLELTARLHSREKTSIRAVALRASVRHLFLDFSELAQRRPWETWIYFLKFMNINLNKCMYIQLSIYTWFEEEVEMRDTLQVIPTCLFLQFQLHDAAESIISEILMSVLFWELLFPQSFYSSLTVLKHLHRY